MVPTKVLEELRQLYESDERVIDLANYAGSLFDVAFDVITADTFVAGIASKIVDRDIVTAEERIAVDVPFLLEDRWWRRDDGQLFDLQPHAEIHKVAISIEYLRGKCSDALSSLEWAEK